MRSSDAIDNPVVEETADDRAEAERLRWERDQALSRADRLERSRRRGSLSGALILVLLVVVVGVGALLLASREGSFAAGGAVVDAKLAEATQPARDAVNSVAERSGQAVERAGQKLEDQGRKLRDAAN